MKKILTLIILLFALTLLFGSFTVFAQQRVTKDAQGNYVIAKRDSTVNKPTGNNIIDKNGQSHPVYITKNGKLYYMRTSKSGNIYKCYIKVS
jgi:uncharacterized protein YxeA